MTEVYNERKLEDALGADVTSITHAYTTIAVWPG